jgi:hypothetical protein
MHIFIFAQKMHILSSELDWARAQVFFFTAGAGSSYSEEMGFCFFESMTSLTMGRGHGGIQRQRSRMGRWGARATASRPTVATITGGNAWGLVRGRTTRPNTEQPRVTYPSLHLFTGQKLAQFPFGLF